MNALTNYFVTIKTITNGDEKFSQLKLMTRENEKSLMGINLTYKNFSLYPSILNDEEMLIAFDFYPLASQRLFFSVANDGSFNFFEDIVDNLGRLRKLGLDIKILSNGIALYRNKDYQLYIECEPHYTILSDRLIQVIKNNKLSILYLFETKHGYNYKVYDFDSPPIMPNMEKWMINCKNFVRSFSLDENHFILEYENEQEAVAYIVRVGDPFEIISCHDVSRYVNFCGKFCKICKRHDLPCADHGYWIDSNLELKKCCGKNGAECGKNRYTRCLHFKPRQGFTDLAKRCILESWPGVSEKIINMVYDYCVES